MRDGPFDLVGVGGGGGLKESFRTHFVFLGQSLGKVQIFCFPIYSLIFHFLACKLFSFSLSLPSH